MPDKLLIDNLLKAFNIESLEDDRPFSRLELNNNDTITKVNDMRELLSKYYIPCKARAYLSDLNDKNIFTILRQCIKTFGFKLYTKEKYIKKIKYLYYTIGPIDTAVARDLKQCSENVCVVTFA
jgi:hypothetical protein